MEPGVSAWMVRLQAQPIKPGHAFRVRFAFHRVEIVHVTLTFPRQSFQASILDYPLDFRKFTLLRPIVIGNSCFMAVFV